MPFAIGDEAFVSSKVALENFGSEFVAEILEKEDKIFCPAVMFLGYIICKLMSETSFWDFKGV